MMTTTRAAATISTYVIGSVRGAENRNRRLSEMVVDIVTGATLSETIGKVKELSTSPDG